MVRINSPGGDVFDGFAIYNLLKQHPARIKVKVDGLAASAASVVAMAGDEIEIADNALMMIHNPWTMAVGDAETMIETAALLEKVKGSIVTTYKARAKLSEDEIVALMNSETWFDAGGAIEAGLADRTAGEKAKVKNAARPWIKNAPKIDHKPEFRLAARARFPRD